jgi:hypothetical protein
MADHGKKRSRPNMAEPKVKRRRGRPPKPVDPNAPPKIVRPRGRPRKDSTLAISTKETASASDVKKQRGRRRMTEEEKEIKAEERKQKKLDEMEEYYAQAIAENKCADCGCVFRSDETDHEHPPYVYYNPQWTSWKPVPVVESYLTYSRWQISPEDNIKIPMCQHFGKTCYLIDDHEIDECKCSHCRSPMYRHYGCMRHGCFLNSGSNNHVNQIYKAASSGLEFKDYLQLSQPFK